MRPVVPVPSPTAAGARARAVAELLRSRLDDPSRASAELPRRLAAAHDASPYLFEPQAVVRAASAAEVGALMAGAREAGVPLTLRGGGTSLAGQAGGAGVLVDVRTDWRHAEVLDDGRRIRLQPGLTIRQANARLARYRRRLGPDPASEAACTVGGMVANNSSGMTCGTTDNAYRTMESLRFVLPSGTVVDSGARDADDRLRADEPELHAGLLRLRDRVRSTPGSRATIERLFAMKNTMGYGLNSLLDHSTPVEMLAHLMIGSEGTLGFVAEAVFRTVEIHDHAATGLLILPGLTDATDALPALLAAGARTAELLDAAALRVSQRDLGASPALRGLTVTGHAALLVEFAEDSAEQLAATLADARPVLDRLRAVTGTELTRDPRERANLWRLRKGLYTAVAGARPPGTTALLEDVAVPMPRLTGTCDGLIRLFDRHGYPDAVIFGHARDGNLHFMLTQSFDTPAEIDRYARFTDDMVDLVLAEGGTLKAEHGTGRAMAPFVRRQYGDELYDVMRELKRLCDPSGLLNPGVLLNDDPTVHLRQLKAVPTVDPELDACVECGYCEPVCPTADVTTTPRQRIVLQRQIALATAAGDEERRRELTADYEYAAVDSCAADSLCVTACPVGIDTGAAMKRLRAERHTPRAQRTARTAALEGRRDGRPGRTDRRARRTGTGDPRRHQGDPWARHHRARAAVERRHAARWCAPTHPPQRAGRPGGVLRGLRRQSLRTRGRLVRRFGIGVPAPLRTGGGAARRTDRHCGSVLRNPVAVQGLPRRSPGDGRADPGRALGGQRRGSPARRVRRIIVHARPDAADLRAGRGGPGTVRRAALRRQRDLHRRASPAGAAAAPATRLAGPASHLLHCAPRRHRRPARGGRGRRRHRHGAGQLGVLRLRR
ncbi:FAD-binding and (Fe-S)-binding domain-containing protein [Micromonospora arida]|uniref:FAD-binding and (Fe-S)-binding domain-containing protein n=1 Tax=Micromonospora arida TaxID=2203715 RepID=UPI003CF56EF3